MFQNPILGPFWALCPNWSQKWISLEKKGNIRITFHCAKNQENLMSHFSENYWRNTTKNSLFHYFLCEIQPILESWDWLKNPAIWLAMSIFAQSQKPEFSQIWNLFNHARITVIQTFIIDHTDKKIKNYEKKLNFSIHSKKPGLGLFFPFWG